MANKKKKKSNIIILRRFPKLNIGTILLAIIFIYISIYVVMYLTKSKVLTYEVNAGQLTADNTFKGVIILDENLVASEYAGNINYFLPNNSRAGVNTIICTVDETGTISSMISNELKNNMLSSNAKQQLSRDINASTKNYESTAFSSAYELLDSIDGSITEYRTDYLTDSLNDIIKTQDISFFRIIKPQSAFLVSYITDNLYGLNSTNVNTDTFSEDNYQKENLRTRSLVGVGSPLYRKINSEIWYVVFPLSETQLAAYSDVSSVKVTFLKQNIKANASLSILNNSDGTYGMLKLDKYLINFLDERFVEFELSESSPSGLKIPVSAVLDKDFFTIPTQFVVEDVESGAKGFRKMSYDTQGNVSLNFVETTLYSEIDGYYYVSKELFEIGDCVIKSNESDEFAVIGDDDKYILGTIGSLKGVYCTNKGYCQFRQINIIDKNDEYYIIARGTKYGLSIYDHIILEQEMVEENQIIY